jgi:hypothetical protein
MRLWLDDTSRRHLSKKKEIVVEYTLVCLCFRAHNIYADSYSKLVIFAQSDILTVVLFCLASREILTEVRDFKTEKTRCEI